MANKKKLPIDFTLFSKVQLTAFISLMVISLILSVGIPIFLSSNMLLSVKTSREYKANELSDEDLISPISLVLLITPAKLQKAANINRTCQNTAYPWKLVSGVIF